MFQNRKLNSVWRIINSFSHFSFRYDTVGPMITVKQQIVYAKNGSSAMLECEVSATLNWVTFKSIFVQCNKKIEERKNYRRKKLFSAIRNCLKILLKIDWKHWLVTWEIFWNIDTPKTVFNRIIPHVTNQFTTFPNYQKLLKTLLTNQIKSNIQTFEKWYNLSQSPQWGKHK